MLLTNFMGIIMVFKNCEMTKKLWSWYGLIWYSHTDTECYRFNFKVTSVYLKAFPQPNVSKQFKAMLRNAKQCQAMLSNTKQCNARQC